MDNKFGKTSRLAITAAKRDDKTIMENVEFTAPFKIMRPFYDKIDMMTVMLLTASAGIMAGDVQEFKLHVKSGARMEFVSQAYEKIHKMEEGCAKRDTYICVEPDAALYYTPLPTIPFAGSDFRNSVKIELADESSKFIYSEVLTCGRLAYGEEFKYNRFQNQVSIYQGGKLIYRDNTRYEPENTDMKGFGMYEGYTHLLSLIICNDNKDDEWIRAAGEIIADNADADGGVTKTACGHIVIRILGRNAQKLTGMTEKILSI